MVTRTVAVYPPEDREQADDIVDDLWWRSQRLPVQGGRGVRDLLQGAVEGPSDPVSGRDDGDRIIGVVDNLFSKLLDFGGHASKMVLGRGKSWRLG